MKGKRVKESSIIMIQRMTPQDVNLAGNVHGGIIVKLMDDAAGAVAQRHARGNAVTASIDHVDFHSPVFIGDLVTIKASLNLVGRTSMEIGVRVESENLLTGEIRHTASAYFTYVALDNNLNPTEVPSLKFETEEEIRRSHLAQKRRAARLHRIRIKR
ncbi:acyl-CoA thioesterase [Chloroflexota bacterium]